MTTETGAQGEGWNLTPGKTPGTVLFAGEIDFSVTPKVREKLLPLLKTGTPEIVLDLSHLSYIDSSGLALFIEVRRMLLEDGRSIRIAGISPQVQKIFHLTQIGELFGLPD